FSQQGDLSVSAQQSLLTSLNLTSCNGVEPEHFLISMLDCADGPLHKVTNRFRPGTNLQSLRETLITATRGRNNFHVAAEWSAQLLTERTVTMFHHMQTDPQWQAADPPR